MKGIAHFMTGIALATCLPEVVELARDGALLPVLGGVAGLLPDLLDFRFVRYFEKYDAVIDPGDYLATPSGRVARASGSAQTGSDPAAGNQTAAQAAAVAAVAAFAAAMREAFETDSARRLIAHTVRCGADLWRRYTIRIDPESQTVAARIGPLVTTGQAVVPGSDLPGVHWVEHRCDFPLSHSYQRTYDVDIFTGPTFRFRREGDGLAIDFLDWHHRWTHSLPVAVVVGVLAGMLGTWVSGSHVGLLTGLVAGLAFAAHALEDQLGHMGCNLLWPFTGRRQRGLGLLHASDPAPNFLTVWTSLVLILINLDRAGPGLLPTLPFLVLAIGVPWLIYGLRVLRRRVRSLSEAELSPDLADRERVQELHDGAVR